MFRWIQKTGLTLTALGLLATAIVFGQVKQIPVTSDDDVSLPPETRLTMETKLVQSNRVVEGLVRGDFRMIENAAGILSDISLAPPLCLSVAGDDSDEAVYEHFRLEFARLSGKLERLARREEPEAVAYVHQNLMATCISCHDYLRDHE